MSGSRQNQKEHVKKIIKDLHSGLSAEEAKEQFERQVGDITSIDIAEIEQELLDEGELTADEIKKFCNVHSLLFQSSLEKVEIKEEDPVHPVNLFISENRKIEELVSELKETLKQTEKRQTNEIKNNLMSALEKLKDINIHFVRKEQQLFPYLEKHGFRGPTEVMWGKDDEVRDLIRESITCVNSAQDIDSLKKCQQDNIDPLIEEVEGMIFREENILFPTALEILSSQEWGSILKESDQVGYCYIERPNEVDELIAKLQDSSEEETTFEDGEIKFPTGELDLKELTYLMNTLPVDITFVDKDDRAKYFTDNAERVFVRTRQILGRKVENCHPPKSLDKVEAIVNDFKNGERDYADFWLNFEGKFVYIIFKPIRDNQGNYLGTAEIAMDATKINGLQGEKRLLDDQKE